MTLGVDVGGTFTDLAWWDGERLRVGKASSTPDQSVGVLDGAGSLLGSEQPAGFLHGTTVATNALLERDGARVVLVTDEGCGDLVAIGRQDRPALYDVAVVRPEPVVPASRRIEVPGRASLDGSPLLTTDELVALVERVEAIRPEAVAIASLYAYLDDRRERQIASALSGLGVPVSTSAAVAPEFREYERVSTTTLNAYLTPKMAAYLDRLGAGATQRGIPTEIQVMRSSGGLMSIDQAASLPAAALLSGPAGGVVAAAALGSALGDARLIAFDMGGTSTDVCRIESGVPEVSFERPVGGLPCRMPSVAVHTVGAGGGSIGWRDSGGVLRVGPQSAGAFPGPASYGRGGEQPAVTDANVMLGRIAPDARLAGSVPVRRDLARAALETLGGSVGLSDLATAEGMLEVVEAHMERAIRAVSVEEGADPRQARLVAFGGAGGLHATALARRLEMRGVVVPPFAGVFSAVGLLLSPPRHDAARSIGIEGQGLDDVRAALAGVEREAVAGLEAMGAHAVEVVVSADVRYRGQAHETSVPMDGLDSWAMLESRFGRVHEERNGFARPGDPIEVVTVRAAALGEPAMEWSDLPAVTPLGDPERGTRPVRLLGAELDARVVWRPGLGEGDDVVGPAVIEEAEATTLLAPGERAVVHGSGALEVSW